MLQQAERPDAVEAAEIAPGVLKVLQAPIGEEAEADAGPELGKNVLRSPLSPSKSLRIRSFCSSLSLACGSILSSSSRKASTVFR